MVKRRPSRAVQSAHGSRIRVFSPESLDCARYVSRVQSEEKCDLLSEKSFMLSSDFPVVEIDASKFNHNHHSRKSNNNHAPILRLPRTSFKNKLADSSQHYVLISNNSLDLPLSSHSENNDRNNPISMDLVNLSAKELAEREATVNKKVRQLKAKGLWMRDRLPKVMEPERLLTHWDFFLEEALWLADDFKQERMWKRAMSKRVRSIYLFVFHTFISLYKSCFMAQPIFVFIFHHLCDGYGYDVTNSKQKSILMKFLPR